MPRTRDLFRRRARSGSRRLSPRPFDPLPGNLDLEFAAMLDGRNARPCFLRRGKVEIRKDHAGLLACLGKNLAPGRDDDTVTEGRAAVLVQAALGRCEHEGAGLDGAGARQDMPMRLAGLLGKGGRDGDELGTGGSERAIERGEAKVVADAQAQPAEGEIGEHRLGARTEILRLAVALAAGKVDIEHMQLVVARGDAALGIDQIRTIGDPRLIELDGDRADMQPNSKVARERLGPGEQCALAFALGRGEHELRFELHDPGVLRRLHILRAAFGCAPDQGFGLVEIWRDCPARAELHQPGTKASLPLATHGSEASASSPKADVSSMLASQSLSLPSRSSAASSSWPPTWRPWMKICGTVRRPPAR